MDNRFEFKQLFPDLQWEVVMKMDDRELVNLCRSSKEMETFCNTRYWFWRDRIVAQFGLDPSDPTIQQMLQNNGDNWFRVYFLLIKLNKLKQKLSPHLDQYNLSGLYNLQELYLSNNQLTELPREIGNLTNLQSLYTNDNRLTEVPTDIGNLTNLQYLDLRNNQLTELPREIGNLNNLKILYLSDNQLTEIPREIGNLTNLHSLGLYNNKLPELHKIEQLLPNTRIG